MTTLQALSTPEDGGDGANDDLPPAYQAEPEVVTVINTTVPKAMQAQSDGLPVVMFPNQATGASSYHGLIFEPYWGGLCVQTPNIDRRVLLLHTCPLHPTPACRATQC